MSELSGDGETGDSPDTPSGGTDATSGSGFAGISDAQVEAALAAEDPGEDPAADLGEGRAPEPPAVREEQAGRGEQASREEDAAAGIGEGTAQPGDDMSVLGESAAADSAGSAGPDVPDVSGGPESYSPDAGAEYDGDVTALLAEEDLSPEPTSRQGLAPVTVEYLSPEARTVGDTTPTGIGRKPSGEEIRDMESDDPAKRRFERLFDEAVKEGGDFSDASGSIGATVEADLHAGSGPSGHPGSYHAAMGSVRDHPAPSDPGVSDAASCIAISGLLAAVVIERAISGLWKEHKPR